MKARPFKFLESENPIDSMVKAGSETAALATEGRTKPEKTISKLTEPAAEEAKEVPEAVSVLNMFNLKFVKERQEQLKRELAAM
jgi:hypothetical protein